MSLEKQEIERFYRDVQEEVNALQIVQEDGANHEELFTEWALSILAESGETENYQVKYDERKTNRGIEHKINGYALSENYETLDLFVTLYYGTEQIQSITKTDAEKYLDRLANFFRNAMYKDYVGKIEESSPIFDLADTLAKVPEVKEFLSRVNLFLITDGEVKADIKSTESIAGQKVFFRVIDINYLFNVSSKTRIPIEIRFNEIASPLPCIKADSENEEYQTYLAIIPGETLAKIYEQYGSRLLEQNVRSFLQFTGKINKGIRKTILEEPHMFLAFNNGIAATADYVEVSDTLTGKSIAYVRDLQIVNGGQTTASIYHTWRKEKADLSKLFVQLKLNVVKNKESFGSVVSRISEYANTQNKVSISDLSSNKPNHIELEKLSRMIWAAPSVNHNQQTRWFYERARGQYKNARKKEELSKSKLSAFDLKNPKEQVFTKEDLAKYINSWREVYDGRKLVVGPHTVVKGSQKNYVQFIQYNFEEKPDNIYFEDTIGKAILFRKTERIYGVKPNSIGDMRYITVPYSIAWLGFHLSYKLDFYKIWRTQRLSEDLEHLMFDLMVRVENFIKNNAPGSLYGEWAKKEECWNALKAEKFDIDLSRIASDLEDPKSSLKRKRISDDDIALAEKMSALQRINDIHYKTWIQIDNWGRTSNLLSNYLSDMASSIGNRIRLKKQLTDTEIACGLKILDTVLDHAPQLFYDMEELFETDKSKDANDVEITIDVVIKLVEWDKKNRKLKDYQFLFLMELVNGKKTLTDRNKSLVNLNILTAKRYGFKI